METINEYYLNNLELISKKLLKNCTEDEISELFDDEIDVLFFKEFIEFYDN